MANVSQVAMVTGMTRRDVRRLREHLSAKNGATSERLNNATRVLFGWYEDPEFVDAFGDPKELPLEGPRSFERLSKRYVGDIRPSTMLKELRRVNSVEITEDRKVRALSRSYRPAQASVSDPELILRAGTVLRDVGTTLRHNLSRETDEPSRYERRATNVRMSPDVIPAFHRYISREAQKFLERVDRWLSKHELPETRLSEHKTIRLGFGGYWIQGDGREKSGVSK